MKEKSIQISSDMLARLAEEVCLWCKKVPKRVSHFCSRSCAQGAQQTSPGLLEVPEGHATFKSIAEQFKVSWRYTTRQCPPVRRVYKIMASQASLDKYEAYRNSVEARGHFKASGKYAGNENRRWHGTRRDCNLGALGHTQFCASTTCFLCCIIKTTFKKSLGGQFGAGIYTSSTSFKSDANFRNTNASPLKAMLLSKVVKSTALTAPPAGYDSVLAEVGGGRTDDELVVYSKNAARPSYLLMYEP
ncbi:hypothetical protein DFH11DRAFT_1595845 [Phellopilus nigrolimitatus]|nr:hypothetical protein DFH11DRAFT_1595845 [Phellopilus nigrolimitatus]